MDNDLHTAVGIFIGLRERGYFGRVASPARNRETAWSDARGFNEISGHIGGALGSQAKSRVAVRFQIARIAHDLDAALSQANDFGNLG